MNRPMLCNLFGIAVTSFSLYCMLPQAVAAESIESRAMKFVSNNAGTSGGKRVALVIGNGSYHHSDRLPKLSNPPHDAEDIAIALRGFGFEVIEKEDQSLEGMNDAIAEFSRKIGDSDAALFYFAGHGLQVKGQNYIIPVNAKLDTEASVEYEGVNVNRVLDEMDNGKSRANIVILDACRNNPISGKFRSGATRGLAAPSSTPKGTVIVYATDPGNVAADGNGRNGLFTAGLLTAFKGSDLSLGGVLARASEEVESGSDSKQIPYINGPATLQKRFQFAPDKSIQVASMESVPTPPVLVVEPRSSEIAMVRIPGKNYEIGKFEITQKEWHDIMDSNPSEIKVCGDNCPVENVSWGDVQEFIQKLNAKTRKQYRLPTEVEWEYACYGGNKTEYCGGNDPDALAWTSRNSNQNSNNNPNHISHQVGQKQANAYGIYDMSGNVWEWCQDWYNNRQKERVLRGGSWNNYALALRAAFRYHSNPERQSNDIGFRLARTLP